MTVISFQRVFFANSCFPVVSAVVVKSRKQSHDSTGRISFVGMFYDGLRTRCETNGDDQLNLTDGHDT